MPMSTNHMALGRPKNRNSTASTGTFGQFRPVPSHYRAIPWPKPHLYDHCGYDGKLSESHKARDETNSDVTRYFKPVGNPGPPRGEDCCCDSLLQRRIDDMQCGRAVSRATAERGHLRMRQQLNRPDRRESS